MGKGGGKREGVRGGRKAGGNGKEEEVKWRIGVERKGNRGIGSGEVGY